VMFVREDVTLVFREAGIGEHADLRRDVRPVAGE
jgi:hypothetical protein